MATQTPKRKHARESGPAKILPGFAVRDEESPDEERDRHKVDEEEEVDKDGFPANEPSREGKFSA